MNGPTYAVDGGTANARTLTLNPAPEELKEGLLISWRSTLVNTSSGVTMDVNGLGAVPLLPFNNSSIQGVIKVGGIYQAIYSEDVSKFIMVGGLGNYHLKTMPIEFFLPTTTPGTQIENDDTIWFELADGVTEQVVAQFNIPEDMDLTVDVNQSVSWSTLFTAVSGGTDVRYNVAIKYLAIGDLTTSADDETVAFTTPIATPSVNQVSLGGLALTKPTVTGLNYARLKVQRLGGDGLDTFTGKIAISKYGIFRYTAL